MSCVRVSPCNQEPDPWAKIHRNQTQNHQKIRERTGTGTTKGSMSVPKPKQKFGVRYPLNKKSKILDLF